jgi:hypothetical protein
MRTKNRATAALREVSEWVIAKGEEKAHSDNPADLGYLIATGDVLGHLRLMRSRLEREARAARPVGEMAK